MESQRINIATSGMLTNIYSHASVDSLKIKTFKLENPTENIANIKIYMGNLICFSFDIPKNTLLIKPGGNFPINNGDVLSAKSNVAGVFVQFTANYSTDGVMKGDPGTNGTNGANGSPGVKGDQGDAGIQGPKGDAGETGSQGPQGPAGQDSTIPGPKGDKGDQGNQGIQGPSGADSTVPGPKGDKGDTGLTGDTGSQGLKGDTGDTGPAGTTSWSGITDKPSTFPPSTHSHTVADTTGLQTALDGKSVTGHGHAIADTTGLQTALDGKLSTSATTANVSDSTDKRYVTDAQRTVIQNTSGANTGNETAATIKTALGISTLSGSNTGDQTVPAGASTVAVNTPLALGTPGSAATYSKGDHAHQCPGGIQAITSQVSINTTITETTIATVTLPTNFLLAGTTFRFRFQGTHQNQATSGILTFRMYLGTNSISVVFPTQTNAVAASYMEFEGIATVRTTGSSGTFIATGSYWVMNASTTSIAAAQGGASTAVVNTTASTPIVKVTAQWATSSATNALLVQNAVIEIVKM
jgi:hypothetical protein